VLSDAPEPERGFDLGGQEVEVELVGLVWLEGVEAGSLPPVPGAGVQGRDDDRSAGGLLVELGRRGEHVGGERGSYPQQGFP
jgi:hypothetical protein